MTTVDPRAILAGRLPGRPTVGWIVGLVATGFCALLVFGLMALTGGPILFGVGFVLALAPVPLLLAAILVLDRLEPEPRGMLIFAFAWGAGAAVLVSAILNTLGNRSLVASGVDPLLALKLSATFGAPLVEETLKGAFLFGLLLFRREEFDGPTDGIIYAGMVGLGFAMAENISYYMMSLERGGAAALAITVVVRGVLAPLSHPIFTAMTGVAVAYAAVCRGATRWLVPLGGLFGAMLLHGLWNGMASFVGLAGLALAYLVLMIVLAGLIVAIVLDRKSLVERIARYLPAYQGTGLVTPADIGMLSQLRTRRQARHWARNTGGLGAMRAMADYQQAATELALLHRHAERFSIDPRMFHFRRDSLLYLMRLARQAFLRRQPVPPPAPWAPGASHSGFAEPVHREEHR